MDMDFTLAVVKHVFSPSQGTLKELIVCSRQDLSICVSCANTLKQEFSKSYYYHDVINIWRVSKTVPR